MLYNQTAQRLYHEVASGQPVYDYHCHLPPVEIAENRQFSNLAQIWLEGDHYKWRALRTLGVDEALITGDASEREKYDAWMAALPRCIGSPLYHWSHLEMNRPFGINGLALGPQHADALWEQTSELLTKPEFSARGIMKAMDVRMVGTTDDPVDDLAYHAAIAADSSFDIKVCPTFRPDRAFKIEAPDFTDYLVRLGEVSGLDIVSFQDLREALSSRLDHFDVHGCLSADHGIERLYVEPLANDQVLNEILELRRAGAELSEQQIGQFATAVQVFLASEYRKRNWVMQLHIGALRNNNSLLFNQLGPNSGGDSIGDQVIADNLSLLLDSMNSQDSLPKTILYCLNPNHSEMMATMAGNFQRAGTEGYVQFGAAWWFNDQRDGMERHLNCLAQYGVLSTFVGMLTDSRSFLSYTRHEYYRRILCNMIGHWAEMGELPNDKDLLDDLIARLCAGNTRRYFELDY